jgi:hypothetical protein
MEGNKKYQISFHLRQFITELFRHLEIGNVYVSVVGQKVVHRAKKPDYESVTA